MSSPLAVVSPARQNARSPLHIQDSITQTPKSVHEYASTTPQSEYGYNDENAFMGLENCSSLDVGEHSTYGEESKVSEVDGPPSSPFQTMVDIEQTRRETPAPEDGAGVLDRAEALGTVRKADMMADDNNIRQNEEQRADENAASEGESGQLYEDAVSERQPDLNTDENATRHEPEKRSFPEVSTITTDDKHNETMSTVYQRGADDEMSDDDHNHARIGHDPMDDTCLSNFSAVPNVDMTLFSKLRADSPMKRAREATLSPRKTQRLGNFPSIPETPGTAKRSSRASMLAGSEGNTSMSPTGSPTPRKYPRGDDTTNLLDLTDQLSAFSRASHAYATQNGLSSPSRRNNRLSPSKTDRFRSPNKLSLLDFDIPPAPTPRSIPTITPRELESLKSSFLSQISSLKATLSGRDAEVASLKEAVSDAERRVGEAWEELRNETAKKEALELEQGGWERRGKEMESVLRKVKSEIVEGERERERLTKRIDEAEKSKEGLESRIVELENQLSAARKTKRPSTSSEAAADPDNKSPEEVAKEVQEAVEKVARELHTLYKGKHETKVAALKKSYEARWEKRVREAEAKLKEALEDNERLKTERDATMSGVVPGHQPQQQQMMVGEETFLRETDQLEAEKKVLEARVKGLEQEMLSVKRDSEFLRSELKTERAEKGELVAVVDEWLAMQQFQQQQQQREQQKSVESPTPRPQAQNQSRSPSEDTQSFRSDSVEKQDTTTTITNENIPPPSNIGRGAPTPGGAGSTRLRTTAAGPTPRVARFGIPASHSRGNSGSGKVMAPPSGLAVPTAGRSGIMSSIERMGRGGGA